MVAVDAVTIGSDLFTAPAEEASNEELVLLNFATTVR